MGSDPTVPLSPESQAKAEGPQSLDEFVGQAPIVKRLIDLKDLFSARGRPLPHLLLVGPENCGKRALATALAADLGASLVTCMARSLERGGDLMGILTSHGEHDLLLLEEIGDLPRALDGVLCEALGRFSIEFVMNARSMKIPLRPFTCIGTTSAEAAIRSTIRSAFDITLPFQPYSQPELVELARAFAGRRHLSLASAAGPLLVESSQGSLKELALLLRFAEKPGISEVSEADVHRALTILGRPVTSTQGGPVDRARLQQLSGPEFEVLVTTLLRRIGFRTELTRPTGDGGIDIVAVLDRPIVGGRYLIQCKRFAADSPVGAPIVREFYGALSADRRTTRGIIITTSAFSAQAREFAANLSIELIDGDQVQLLFVEYGVTLG